jgi:hypothetical protein
MLLMSNFHRLKFSFLAIVNTLKAIIFIITFFNITAIFFIWTGSAFKHFLNVKYVGHKLKASTDMFLPYKEQWMHNE